MRLICPSCGAQYEVPDEVIPQEGRDVQCSSCSNTWFQTHPDHDRALADEMDAPSVEPIAPPPAAAPVEEVAQPDSTPQPAQRSLDQSVADVLREEARIEAEARAAERSEPLESQPDLGLTDPVETEADRRAREARERMAKMRGEPVPVAAPAAAAGAAAASVSRSDLLPDIEEINSTLRASGERRRPSAAEDADLEGTAPKLRRKNHGFRRGFLLMIVMGAIAVASYVYGPRIGTLVPAAAPYVAQYSEQVDGARDWLSTNVDRGLAWLDQLASENL